LCVATPEVLKSIGQPIYAQGNPAYKVHFYLIALVILLSVVNVLYGYTRMLKENDRSPKKPLMTQLVCALVFIGLCIWACFTAFYRNGTLDISALSASLMAIFFVVFGVTLGVYFSCIFYGRRRFLSLVLPAVVASATTAAMYAGELVLMDGALFRLGSGAFFEPLGGLPLSPADISIILAAGALTLVIAALINRGTAQRAPDKTP
jgi:O-antigen/teichoic acid export membrane protein